MTLKVVLHDAYLHKYRELGIIQGLRKEKSSTAAIAQSANLKLNPKIEVPEVAASAPRSIDADNLFASAEEKGDSPTANISLSF